MVKSAVTELPTGTVTFLFSDIEGSTRLVQQLDDEFAEVLAQHQALMRSSLAQHGGLEVSTEGDSFFAVFTSAKDAVAAAADAQRAHATYAFAGGALVRVRIGVHSGIGTAGGDNYVGLDVHRGARIAAAAHGGEVLISDATRALVSTSLPAEISIRDLGMHRLKDLEAPESLFRLVIAGLPDDFPPPRSLGSGDNLPQPATSFIGRQEELTELADLLSQTRLLTLTGPGGTGKTRLALETARRAAGAHRDGAFFIPLDAIRDPELVASAAVEALHITDRTRPDEEALIAYVSDRRMLLVFDNFEQVMAASGLIDRLLTGAAELRVIVTSREPLQLYGEQEYRVAPLPMPDLLLPPTLESVSEFASVALFVARARAVDQRFSLTSGNAPAVAEICVLLDGLPLAIELAAARVKLLPPSAILERLGHRLDILAVQSPNLPLRQRTMRAAIDWSWELLGDGERRLLERLAVFRGGWDLDAAEAVCQPAELGLNLLDGTASLLDKSLVVRAPGEDARFALLQTIGEFAYERLVARDQAQAAQRRHAVYFCDLAEAVEPTLAGPGAAAGTSRLAAEQENLRAALAWAIAVGDPQIGLRLASAIWRFWQQRGQLAEGRVWFDSLLALPAAADISPELRAKALTAAGGVAYWRGDSAMQDCYAAALEIYRSLGDERGIADSLQNLGFVQMTGRRGEPGAMEDGARLFEESLATYQKLDDKPNIASVTGALGYSRLMAGHPEEARAAVSQAMALHAAQGLIARANDNLFALAHINLLTGDFTAAAEQYRKALVDSHEMGDVSRELVRLSPAASLLAATGHHDQALRLAGAVGRLREEQGGILAILPPGLTDPVLAAQGAGLTHEQIEEYLTEGRSMDLEGAFQYALKALPL